MCRVDVASGLHVGLLSSVCKHVALKMSTSREVTLAGFALERFFFTVSKKV